GERARRVAGRALRRVGHPDPRRVALPALGGGRDRRGTPMSQSFFLTFPPPPSTTNDVRAVPDASPSAAPNITVLVDRARRRDPAAFRELFHAYLGLVHRVVR